jgi:hypothetical protein
MSQSPQRVEGWIARLSETAGALRHFMPEFTEGALRRPPQVQASGVETFSAIGHVCHLRDIEIEGYQVRIRRLRSEENPVLPSLSGERLAIERQYDLEDRDRALAAFEAGRQESLVMLRSVEPPEWDRAGAFEGYGQISLLRLVEIMVEHDSGHLQALLQLPRT